MIESIQNKDRFLLGRSYLSSSVAQPAEYSFYRRFHTLFKSSLRHTHSYSNDVYVIGIESDAEFPCDSIGLGCDSSASINLLPIGTLRHTPTLFFDSREINVNGGHMQAQTQRETRVRRGAIRQCWKLADEIQMIGEQVRQANRPSELYPSQTALIELSIKVRDIKAQWLSRQMKFPKDSWARWPHV